MKKLPDFIKLVAVLLVTAAVPLSAGPFTFSGQTTIQSVDTVYQRSSKVTGEQSTAATDAVAEVSAQTSRDLYAQSTEPVLEVTGDSVYASSEASSDASTVY